MLATSSVAAEDTAVGLQHSFPAPSSADHAVWPKEGFTGKDRETVPDPHQLLEVTNRLWEAGTEPTRMKFEEPLNKL